MASEITVILGAGASAFAGVPSTRELSDLIFAIPLPAITYAGQSGIFQGDASVPLTPLTVPATRLLFQALRSSTLEPTFEDALHGVEEGISYTASRGFLTLGAEARPFIASLTEPTFRWESLFDVALLQHLRAVILRELSEGIRRTPLVADNALRDVFASLASFNLSCFTLNYDLLADDAFAQLGLNVNDGFPSLETASVAPFESTFALPNSPVGDESRLLHLHGSIAFGYEAGTPGELFKFRDPVAAIDSQRLGIGMSALRTTQSREILQLAPIISGLRKLEKIAQPPFSYYYEAFVQSLLRSKRLLVIGYGGHDDHINGWLREFSRRNEGEPFRVVEITRSSIEHSVCQSVLLLGVPPVHWAAAPGDMYSYGSFSVYTGGLGRGMPPSGDALRAHFIF